MFNIKLQLICMNSKLEEVDRYSLHNNDSVFEVLNSASKDITAAELMLNINNSINSLCLYQFDKKNKQWAVVGNLVREVSKKDIEWAKKTFLASENAGPRDAFWTIRDLRTHFSMQKSKPENPKPQKHQNTKSVDGMIEYLFSVGYIE